MVLIWYLKFNKGSTNQITLGRVFYNQGATGEQAISPVLLKLTSESRVIPKRVS